MAMAATAFISPLTAIAGRKGDKPAGLKPLIKYRGGKSKELPQYVRFIPTDYDTYYEPFFGGGATFFHVMPKKAVIGDINEPLMNFYTDVRDTFDKLAA